MAYLAMVFLYNEVQTREVVRVVRIAMYLKEELVGLD